MTKIDWQPMADPKPPMATRVLVKTGNGLITFGRLTIYGWVDDNSLPIRGVVGWSEVE